MTIVTLQLNSNWGDEELFHFGKHHHADDRGDTHPFKSLEVRCSAAAPPPYVDPSIRLPQFSPKDRGVEMRERRFFSWKSVTSSSVNELLK